MGIREIIFGKPICTKDERQERIGALPGIPVLGLDALASAAYGPEAALAVLMPLGVLAPAYILPVISLIIVLLVVVSLSYRQTIAAYPQGGGSFTVAKENLGPCRGLFQDTAYPFRPGAQLSRGAGAFPSFGFGDHVSGPVAVLRESFEDADDSHILSQYLQPCLIPILHRGTFPFRFLVFFMEANSLQ